MNFDELRAETEQITEQAEKLEKVIHLDEKLKKAEKLEETTTSADFWNNTQKAKEVTKALDSVKRFISEWNDIKSGVEDMNALAELVAETGEEPDILKELAALVKNTGSKISHFEIKTLLSGKYDQSNTYLSIHPGAGGTESQDWAQMLMRMYTRWCEISGFSYEILDVMPGETAGIKSATIKVDGDYSFGFLKAEKGIHRLVRISPFDANKRRHTSFVSIDVFPEIDDDIEVEIDESDLRIDTYRASGAGGQHVNKTDSAVRITHLPTKIVVQCQNERSQHANKATAMKMLKAKLFEKLQKEQEKEMEEIKGEKMDIAWGSQIRSYVFHPYNMVKDHRTNVETGNIQSVMDGNIDDFIQGFLFQTLKKD